MIPHPRRRPSESPTRSCSASRGRSARPASRSPTTAPQGFLAAVAVVGPRRRRGDVRRGPGHALRVTRRPGPLRPGVRGLLQRARRAAPAAAGRGGRPDVLRAAAWPRATERPVSPTTRWCGRWPATPRCCGTATWPRCPRRRRRGWPACSRPCGRGPRGGVPPGTSGGTAAPSTRRARCAPACGGWASPRRSRWRRRGNKPRRVVLLVDVSGSMSGYADALLRLAHRFTQGGGRRSRRSPSAPG